MWRRFEVEIVGEVVIEFDDSIMPDYDWRKNFYDISTLSELAKHLAYNFAINNGTLTQLDGWADRRDDMAELISAEWDMENVIETTDMVPYPKHTEHLK